MALTIDLHGKHALITGVSSGIGLGIAAAMAEAGCNVAGCGLDSESSIGAVTFQRAVEGHGRSATYTPIDLRDDAGLRGWVAQAAAQLGGIDFVISNAGRSAFEGVSDCSDAAWNDALNLNLAAHWRLCQAARPYLLAADEPVIVVITSNHAYSTIPGCFPYNVAKAGLLGLVQSLAIEWGPKVRAVGIAPGFIDTALTLAPGTRVKEIETLPNLRRWLAALPEGPLTRVLHRFFLRSMKKAKYDPEDVGHFGLAVEGYCHFTSPIRRYPDLWNHRRLKEHLDGLAASRREELEERATAVGRLSSATEVNVEEADLEMALRTTARFLERPVDLVVATDGGPERQHQETGKIGVEDDPDGVVELDAGERDRPQEHQQGCNGKHHAGQRIRQFDQQVDQPDPPLLAPGDQVADRHGDEHRKHCSSDGKSKAVEECAPRSGMLEQDETVVVEGRGG